MVEYRARRGAAIDWGEPVRPVPPVVTTLGPRERFEIRSRRSGRVIDFAQLLGSTGANTFTITPTGGLSFAGTGGIAHEDVLGASGGVSFAGTAVLVKTRVIGPTGGVAFGGVAPSGKTRVITPAGGVVFAGNAGLLYIPAGGIVGGNISRISLGLARGSRIS